MSYLVAIVADGVSRGTLVARMRSERGCLTAAGPVGRAVRRGRSGG